MDDNNKYGFSFEWFLIAYDKLNCPKKVINLDENIKNEIMKIYNKNCLNYVEFIDGISILLNISNDDKIKYLEIETKCIICKKNYPHYWEQFVVIYDLSKNNITDKLCYDCLYCKYIKCNKCDYDLRNEPYEEIYICNDIKAMCNKCNNDNSLTI